MCVHDFGGRGAIRIRNSNSRHREPVGVLCICIRVGISYTLRMKELRMLRFEILHLSYAYEREGGRARGGEGFVGFEKRGHSCSWLTVNVTVLNEVGLPGARAPAPMKTHETIRSNEWRALWPKR